MNKLYLSLCAALLLVLTTHPAAAQPSYYSSNLNVISLQSETGKSAVDKGELKKALRTFQLALRQAPVKSQRSQIFGDLCAIKYMMGNMDQALKYCNRAVKLSDNNWRAHNNRGIIHLRKAEYIKAQRDFSYALQLNPTSKSLRKNLVEVRQKDRINYVEN